MHPCHHSYLQLMSLHGTHSKDDTHKSQCSSVHFIPVDMENPCEFKGPLRFRKRLRAVHRFLHNTRSCLSALTARQDETKIFNTFSSMVHFHSLTFCRSIIFYKKIPMVQTLEHIHVCISSCGWCHRMHAVTSNNWATCSKRPTSVQSSH